MSEHPVSGGGFADIFMGAYAGGIVALKVLRCFATDADAQKLHRVRGCFKFLSPWTSAFSSTFSLPVLPTAFRA